MTAYLLLKYLHIVGAAVLLGTGAGISFFLLMAHRTGKAAVIAAVARIVVIADLLFTASAVVVQPITGVLLAWLAGYSLSQGWIALSLLLYLVAGAFWLPVLWMQARMRDPGVPGGRDGRATAQGVPPPALDLVRVRRPRLRRRPCDFLADDRQAADRALMRRGTMGPSQPQRKDRINTVSCPGASSLAVPPASERALRRSTHRARAQPFAGGFGPPAACDRLPPRQPAYSGLIATLRNLITPAPCWSASGPSANRPLLRSAVFCPLSTTVICRPLAVIS